MFQELPLTPIYFLQIKISALKFLIPLILTPPLPALYAKPFLFTLTDIQKRRAREALALPHKIPQYPLAK